MSKFKLFVFSLILHSTTFFSANSQTIKFSPTELDNNFVMKLIGKGDTSIWVVQKVDDLEALDGSGSVFTEYSNDLVSIVNLEIDKLKIKPYKIYDAIVWDNKLTWLSEISNGWPFSKKGKIRSRLLLERPFDSEQFICVDSSEYSFFNLDARYGQFTGYALGVGTRDKGFLIAPGSDNKDAYITNNISTRLNDQKEVKVYLVSDQMQMKGSSLGLSKAELPMNGKGSTNFSVGSDYLVLRTNVFNSKENLPSKFQLSIIDIKSRDTKEITIPQQAEYLYAEWNSSISSDHILTLKGFFKNAKSKSIDGYYSYAIDLNQAKLIQSLIVPLSAAGKSAFSAIENARGEVKHYSNLIEMHDGSKICIIESFNPARLDQNRTSNPRELNFYVVSFDKAGNFQWSREIVRDEKVLDYSAGEWSYGLLINKDKIHIYFNQEDKVLDCTVTYDGTVIMKNLNESIADKEVRKFQIYPKRGFIQLSDKEIVFTCSKDKRSTLVKFTY